MAPSVTYGPGPKLPKKKGEPRSATTVSDSSAKVQYPDSTAHEPEPTQDPPDDDAVDRTDHRP